ncbi:MAG: hypothetical protein HYX94_11695 [Chloroflexi bacterium]|nr:hypothetical protein [Chloroflexota bacterium]
MSILQGLINLIADLYYDLVYYASIRQGSGFVLGLAAIVILSGLTLYFSRRLRPPRSPFLRRIEGVADLDRNVEAAVEDGRSLHFSLGTGSLGDSLTVQTLAGLDLSKEMGRKAAASGPPLIATTSSALAFPILESVVHRAYAETTGGLGYQEDNSRFIAPDPVAYAAGVMQIVEEEDVGFNVMAGSFGPEYLLMGEAAAKRGVKQLVAAADPTVLPFVVATADYPVIGEELFALSAYVRPTPVRLGSVMAQDTFRLIVVILILALTILLAVDPELGRQLGLGL